MYKMLDIKTKDEVRFDLLSLGEVLLRFDPGDTRIEDAHSFTVWDGGAEYNVAANLSRVFRLRTSIATAMCDNPLGRLAEGLVRKAGVDTSNIKWRADGRNGIYFIERGFGIRAPASAFDREHTAVSKLQPKDLNPERFFAEGIRWFHTGGVFAGLSASTPETAQKIMAAAREQGAVVSYDLNYRDSLWRERGGIDAANAVNRMLLPFADVVFGVFGFDPKLSAYTDSAFAACSEKMIREFPNLKVVVSTLRETHSADRHSLGAAAFAGGKVITADPIRNVDVLDRVGSGDAFAAGTIYGILAEEEIETAINCGTALGALTMTTPGDTAAVSSEEVFGIMHGEGSAVRR